MSDISEFLHSYNETLMQELAGADMPPELSERFAFDSCVKRQGGREVYFVTQKTDGRRAVLRITDADSGENAIAESAILAKLDHPAIPKLLGAWKHNGRGFLVREYFEGDDLGAYIRKHGILKIEQITNIANQICDILKYLHNQDPPVIHRDIKPENIVIANNFEVKLIDFGIARNIRYESEFESENDTHVAGTRPYMSPEQFGSEQTDSRADIYALGVVLIYMATGNTDKQNLKNVYPYKELALVIEKCIRKDRDQRYHNVEKMKKSINRIKWRIINKSILFITIIVIIAAVIFIWRQLNQERVAEQSPDIIISVLSTSSAQNTAEDMTTVLPTDMTADKSADMLTDLPTDLPTDSLTDLPTDLPTDLSITQPTDIPVTISPGSIPDIDELREQIDAAGELYDGLSILRQSYENYPGISLPIIEEYIGGIDFYAVNENYFSYSELERILVALITNGQIEIADALIAKWYSTELPPAITEMLGNAKTYFFASEAALRYGKFNENANDYDIGFFWREVLRFGYETYIDQYNNLDDELGAAKFLAERVYAKLPEEAYGEDWPYAYNASGDWNAKRDFTSYMPELSEAPASTSAPAPTLASAQAPAPAPGEIKCIVVFRNDRDGDIEDWYLDLAFMPTLPATAIAGSIDEANVLITIDTRAELATTYSSGTKGYECISTIEAHDIAGGGLLSKIGEVATMPPANILFDEDPPEKYFADLNLPTAALRVGALINNYLR